MLVSLNEIATSVDKRVHGSRWVMADKTHTERCDTLAANNLAFIQLASIRLWLRINKTTTSLASWSRLHLLAQIKEPLPRIARQEAQPLAQIVETEVIGAHALRELLPGQRRRD